MKNPKEIITKRSYNIIKIFKIKGDRENQNKQ